MNTAPTPPTTPGPQAPRARTSDELALERTDLAVDRTLMAADRSLMAWVRTGLSMISFGFTIYKIIEGLAQSGPVHSANMARNVGLFLTGLGTVAIVMGTLEYGYRVKGLRKARAGLRILQPSFVIALVMSVAGVLMFLGIVSRVL